MEPLDMKKGNMKVTNIQQQEAPTKYAETAKRVEGEKPALFSSSIAEKCGAVRKVDVARCGQSLVTLAPDGVEFSPKQQVMAEQFRLLRTRVKALSKDFQLRTMLITSALPGEGKTTVAANLAGSLSRVEGLRVLLMDFDLRRPSLHTVFGVEPDMRSPSPFGGKEPWQSSVYQVNRRLDVLFGFRPLEEPDRLLQSSRLENLLDEAKAGYDVVILDSAPMLAISDTHSLVPLVDCGIFVLNADKTPIGAAREALAMLRDKVAGCIVNRVEHLKSEGYYRDSGYGYGYGSKHSEN
jgi:capsular exopolysaccharide synthesis family protein